MLSFARYYLLINLLDAYAMPIEIPYINENTAYRFKVTITEDSLPAFTVPSDWLNKAHQLFPGLDKHTLDAGQIAKGYSAYKGRLDLVRSIKFFYGVLTDYVMLPGIDINESMKQVIKAKILEQIEACSEGFHNRINGLYGLFFVPKTISELLQRVRQGILTSIVTQDGDEVHRQNYLKLRASQLNYGVECPNSQDGYNGQNAWDADAVINQGFHECFQALPIVIKLNEEIKSVLISSFGYRGRLEGSDYDKGDYDGFRKYINDLFGTRFSEQELFDFDEDCHVIDLKWHLVAQTLWSKIKTDIFVLPKPLSNAFTILFEMPLEAPNEATINRALVQIKPFVTSFENYQRFASLFPVLSHKQSINLMFDASVCWQHRTVDGVVSLSKLNSQNSEYLTYLRETFKERLPDVYANLHHELQVSKGSQPLMTCFLITFNPVADVLAKLRLLSMNDRVALLNTKNINGQTIFKRILEHNYSSGRRSVFYTSTEDKRRLSVHQSMPLIFSLLNDFNESQLNHFFLDNNYLKAALENNRSCLKPMLELLEKCSSNVIVQQSISPWAEEYPSALFLSLLNSKETLALDHKNVFNNPLDEQAIELIQTSLLSLLKKVPAGLQDYLLLNGSENNFLLTYHSLNLSQEQGVVLFSCLSSASTNTLLKALPGTLEEYSLAAIISVICVANQTLAFNLLSKKISYSQGIFSKQKEVSLARFLFFSSNYFTKFVLTYKKMDKTHRRALNALIFIKPEVSELAKWLSCMGKQPNLADYQMISEELSSDKQLQLISQALTKSRANWPIILPMMTAFSAPQLISLFEVKTKHLFWTNTNLKHNVIETASFHKPFVDFLKALKCDDVRTALISQLFVQEQSFLGNVISDKPLNADSFELLKSFPYSLIFSMLRHASAHKGLHEQMVGKYVELLPALRKGKCRQALETKHRFERNAAGKAELKIELDEEVVRENERNSLLAIELKQSLLLVSETKGKSLFQMILEQSPTKAFQLLYWLEFFDKEHISQGFMDQAINNSVSFNETALLNVTGSFNDVLALVGRAPSRRLLKSLQSLSVAIEQNEQLLAFFDFTKTLSGRGIKYLLELKSGSIPNTLFERLSAKEDYRNLLTCGVAFIKEQRHVKQITFDDVLDINRCFLMGGADEEKQRFLFAMAWQGDLLQKQQALRFWKSLKNISAHVTFTMLQSIGTALTETGKHELFSFDGESKHSVLHHFIENSGSFVQSDWSTLLSQLSDDMFYSLLLNETYGDGKLPLYALVAKNHTAGFFKLYACITARVESQLKESVLIRSVDLSTDVFKALSCGPKPIDYSGYVSYCLKRPVTDFSAQVIDVLKNGHNVSFTELKRLFSCLCETEEGQKYFSSLLLLSQANNDEPLFLRLIRKQQGLFEQCFSVFERYSPQEKLNLLTRPFQQSPNLYLEVSGLCGGSYYQSCLYTSAQRHLVMQNIALMPHEHWQQLTTEDDRYFFDTYHLDKDYLLSPYLFTKTPGALNRLISTWGGEPTYSKVFQELNSDTAQPMQDFLVLLRESVSAGNIDKLFSIKMQSGNHFATDVLMDHPSQRSLIMSCLAKLTIIDQQDIIARCFYGKASNVSVALKPWLDVKVLLLRLEVLLSAFEMKSQRDSQTYANPHKVLQTLLGQLNGAYTAALAGKEQDKGVAIAVLKQLLNEPATRQVLNSHRGIKKIVLNILLAFAGLGIGYLAGCLLNLYLTKGEHFFFHPSTKTESIVADMEIKIDGIAHDLAPLITVF